MTSQNKELHVMTNGMVLFKMKASHWEPVWVSSEESVEMAVKVFRAEPGNGTPAVLVAEFPAVHAVYFADEVTLVKPEE